MTIDQITGIIRAVLAAVGGFVLGKGWFDAATWNWIVGGIVTIVPIIWTFVSNRPAAIAASAQNLTGVNVQTTAAAGTAVQAAVAQAKASG